MTKRLRWAISSLTGVTAWLIHLLMIYAMGEFLCVAQGTWFVALGFNTTQWSIAIVTLILFAIALYAAHVAWQEWKSSRALPDTGGNRGGAFLMGTGLISNLFFALVILGEALPIFFLGEGC